MHRLSRLLIPAIAVVLAGCGSGGGGGSSSGGNAQLGVFVTDSFREDYSHVWATIFKVELVNALSQPVTVFDDSTGRIIDVKTLRDSTGQRFSFLSNAAIPAGNYTSVRVTVGPAFTLIPVASTTGATLPLADSVPRDAQGHAQVTFNLPAAKNMGGSDDLVIDFDLANFNIALGKIAPVLKEGGKNGIGDANRHEEEDYEGVVSGLSGTAPNFTFTLTHSSRSIIVVTDANTTLFNAGASPNPTLANSKLVHVRGKFNASSIQLAAVSVKIHATEDTHHPEVKGAPSAIDATAGTFTVAATKVSGFVPAHTTVNVVTNANTVFRGKSGVTLAEADFFTRLATATSVEVEGTYDSASNTLTAARAKTDDEGQGGGDHSHDHEAEAKGTATNVATATFTLNPVDEFEGFSFGGGSLNVATTNSTTYKRKNGESLTSTAFFAALATATSVQVEGTFADGMLTATKAQLK